MKLSNEQLIILSERIRKEVNDARIKSIKEDPKYKKFKKDFLERVEADLNALNNLREKISNLEKDIADLQDRISSYSITNPWQLDRWLEDSGKIPETDILQQYSIDNELHKVSITTIKEEILLADNQNLSRLVDQIIEKFKK